MNGSCILSAAFSTHTINILENVTSKVERIYSEIEKVEELLNRFRSNRGS